MCVTIVGMKKDRFQLLLEAVTLLMILISQMYKRTILECISLTMAIAVCFIEFRQPHRDRTVNYLFLGLIAALTILLIVSILQVIYPAS